VDGLIKLMESDSTIIGPINLGNPTEHTMLEIADKIINMSSSSSKKVFVDLPADDPKQRKPDISRAQRELDWNPSISLEKGLEETINYFRSI
jgi:UDP-glucuronate decarboxylase